MRALAFVRNVFLISSLYRRRLMALFKVFISFFFINIPVLKFSTILGALPASVVITDKPEAIASRRAAELPSISDGNTNIEAFW